MVFTNVPLPGAKPIGPYSNVAVPLPEFVKLTEAVVAVKGVTDNAVGGGQGGAF